MIACLTIIAGMLTACGSGKKRSNLSNPSTFAADSFSIYATQQGAFTPTPLGGMSQSLPQNTLNTNSSQASSNSAPNNGSASTSSNPWGSGMDGQLTFSAAQDFGLMTSCYQQTLNQGRGFFRQGYTGPAIFSGAGEEIVSCYRQVIAQRTQELQAVQQYQQQLYQWQYQQQMQQLYQFLASLNSQKIYEPVRPPALQGRQPKQR